MIEWRAYTPDEQVYVRIVCVVVVDGDPFQLLPKVPLHLSHDPLGHFAQVYPFAEFRADHHFEEAWILGFFPLAQSRRDRLLIAPASETDAALSFPLGALPLQVVAVLFPSTVPAVRGVPGENDCALMGSPGQSRNKTSAAAGHALVPLAMFRKNAPQGRQAARCAGDLLSLFLRSVFSGSGRRTDF